MSGYLHGITYAFTYVKYIPTCFVDIGVADVVVVVAVVVVSIFPLFYMIICMLSHYLDK